MQIFGEFDYRNAKAIINSIHPTFLTEIYDVLTDPTSAINLAAAGGAQRQLSRQVKDWFLNSTKYNGWREEQPCTAVPSMIYDLLKDGVPVPIEVELGHQRLVYPDFFEFLADFSNNHIPAAIMIVTGTPESYGHNWHCSLRSTSSKIVAIQQVFLVPILVIGINP